MSETLVPAQPSPLVEAGASTWPAPAGVLGSAEGIQAALTALGLEGLVRREGEVIHFGGARRAVMAAALTGALAGVFAYVLADSLGASPIVAVTAVTVAALFAPSIFVPTYRVAGRVEGGHVIVKVKAHGLFARSRSFEKRLRFYLDRG